MISMRLRRLWRRLSYQRLALLLTGNAGAYPLAASLSQSASYPRSPSSHLTFRQAAEQRPCADIITHLPGGDEQFKRSPLAVADGTQLGVHTAFGAADQVATPPI